MTGRLAQKRAIVFGAGSVGQGWGNGKASAVHFAREGACVHAVDINLAAAEDTAAIIRSEGGTALAQQADVTRAGDLAAVVDKSIAEWGGVDVAHFNVGTNTLGGPLETSEEEWNRILNTNLTAAFLVAKAVLPAMLAARGGSLINTSSLAAIRVSNYRYISYYASKAGLNHFTRALALEFADKGIRANTISPGLIDTPHIDATMASHHGDRETMRAERAALSPMKRMGTAWDVAHAAAFLASDDAAYITGIDLPVDGGLHVRI